MYLLALTYVMERCARHCGVPEVGLGGELELCSQKKGMPELILGWEI